MKSKPTKCSVKRLEAGDVLPPPRKLNLRPGDVVKYGDKVYKVDRRLNIEAREVPRYCQEDKLAFIDSLSHAECKEVHDRAQARLSQMRTEDLLVYGIQRTYQGDRRYCTCMPALGRKQCLATDMGHSRLWLTARRAVANHLCKAFASDWPRNATWEVFELPKTVAIKLPCYTECKYGENKEMVG